MLSPLFVTFMDVAGIRAMVPGFTHCQVRPQLADLGSLDLQTQTVRGPIRFRAEAEAGGHRVTLTLPPGCEGTLLVPEAQGIDLPPLSGVDAQGLKRFRIEPGKEHSFRIPQKK